jgi:hypothetical protein
MYIIHQNRWRITQGTQPERRISHLESRRYNKSDPGPKALASLKLDERKSFLICLKALLNFPKHRLYIIHTQPSVLLGSHPSSSYSSSFLVLPLHFINLRMRFLLREEGCNTPCYGFLNYLHYCLNLSSNLLVNQVLLGIKEILYIFNSNLQSKSMKFLV